MSQLEKDTTEKLDEFFGRIVKPDEFSKSTRRFIMETIQLMLSAEDVLSIDREVISEGHYFLHELCEILDPHLTKE